MKKLPKIYKNSEAKPINNNKNIYYSNTVEKADRNEKKYYRNFK